MEKLDNFQTIAEERGEETGTTISFWLKCGKNYFVGYVRISRWNNHENRQCNPVTLFECLNIPEKLKQFVNDYKINLFEITKLTDSQISCFKSDFKVVADNFAKRNKVPDYSGTKDVIKHVDEFFKLMKVLTKQYI